MRRTDLIRSAATIVAALGLGACSHTTHPAATPPDAASPPPPIAPAPAGSALPPDFVLIDVMNKLSDPALPGDQKVVLIEGDAAGEAADLDRFAIALRDNGSLPLAIETRDLAWSQSDPGNVVATVLVRTANPADGEFSYPMEFAGEGDSWQLTRQSADLLLGLGGDESTAPPDVAPPAAPAAPPPMTPPEPTPPR